MYSELEKRIATIHQKMMTISLRLTKNIADSKDLYQETMVRILMNQDRFQPNTNFEAWAITIMRNIFINSYRKKMRQSIRFDASPDSYLLNQSQHYLPNEGEMKIIYSELMQLVNYLSDDFKVPLLMVYKGYSYDEIANQLNTPIGTIKSRVFTARRKLRRIYKSWNIISE